MNGLTLGAWDPRWISAERKAQGLSQAKLSRAAGLSVHQVRNVERSRAARISHVALVLSALGVESTDELRERHGPRASDLKFDGPSLRAVREERGMAQTTLARLAGVNVTTLRKLEAGLTDPSVRVAVRVLRALGLAAQLPRFLVVAPEEPAPAESPREEVPAVEPLPEPVAPLEEAQAPPPAPPAGGGL